MSLLTASSSSVSLPPATSPQLFFSNYGNLYFRQWRLFLLVAWLVWTPLSECMLLVSIPSTDPDPNQFVIKSLRYQRDLAASLPINKVMWSGTVATRTVFEQFNFSYSRFTQDLVSKTLQNGIRRIVLGKGVSTKFLFPAKITLSS